MRLPRLSRPLVAAVVVLGAGGFGGAYQLLRGYKSNEFHYSWPTHSTAIYIDPVLKRGSAHGDATRRAAALWSAAPGSDWTFICVDGFHDPVVGDLDNANDFMLVNLPTGLLGFVYWRYGPAGNYDLYDMDVAMSAGPYGGMRIWNSSNSGPGYAGGGYYDFQLVAAHELGHVMGFAHHTLEMDGPSVMGHPTGPGRLQTVDDLAGVAFLYPVGGAPPKPGGNSGGGSPDPGTSLPIRTGFVRSFECGAAEAEVGEAVRVTVTVAAPPEGGLRLQSVVTAPSTTGGFPLLTLDAGETRTFEFDRTVTDLPGLYPKAIRFLGQDPERTYSAAASLPADALRVSREAAGLPIQDALGAALGPVGEDRIRIFLQKGARVALDWSGGAAEGAPIGVTVQDPAGRAVRVRPGGVWSARATGEYEATVRNPAAERANYGMFTSGVRRPPSSRVRGTWTGSGTAEVRFPAMARTAVEVTVSGPERLGLRITGLRDPLGREVEVAPGASVEMEEAGLDGEWTALVEGAGGESGRFRLRTSAEWRPGEQTSR